MVGDVQRLQENPTDVSFAIAFLPENSVLQG